MPKILIVDDEWLTRLEIEKMLTDLGYDVAGQRSAAELDQYPIPGVSQAAFFMETTSLLPSRLSAFSMRGSLVWCLGDNMRRISFSSTPSFPASFDLLVPSSCTAIYRAALADIWAESGMACCPFFTGEAFGMLRPSEMHTAMASSKQSSAPDKASSRVSPSVAAKEMSGKVTRKKPASSALIWAG